MKNMDKKINQEIQKTLDVLFPYGSGQASYERVKNALETISREAFSLGRDHALLGLMNAADVAAHFGISVRRARALIKNRNERGVGMRVGNEWLVHRDELPLLQPDEKYRKK